MIFLGVGGVVFVLASLGRFQNAVLFPWVFGPIWTLSGALLLAFRRRSLSGILVVLTVAGCVLALLSPVGQLMHFRMKHASWEREALARFEATGTPSLEFAHVVNNQRGTWRNDSNFGGITLLNFWATWCSPCLKEMPLLEAFSRSHDPAVVRIVGFTRFYEGKDEETRREELARIEQLLRRAGVTYPTLVGVGTTTQESYRVQGLPTTILIGRDGRAVAYGVGERGTRRLLELAHELAVQ